MLPFGYYINATCLVVSLEFIHSNCINRLVTIIHSGAGIHVTNSELSYSSSSLPNNSIILPNYHSGGRYYKNVKMGFYCCSNSTSAGQDGIFIGLNDNPYSGGWITISRQSSSSSHEGCMYLHYEKRLYYYRRSYYPPFEYGIYTCRMPDTTGRNIDVNVGIYPRGYRGKFSPYVYNSTDKSLSGI